MISFIISLLTPLLILIGHLQIKRKGGLGYLTSRLKMKRDGDICYNCSTYNSETIDSPFNGHSRQNTIWLCKSCFRQIRIFQINNKLKFYLHELGRLVIHKNFDKFEKLIIIVGILLIISQFTLYFLGISVSLSIITNTLLCFLWTLIIFRNWFVLK